MKHKHVDNLTCQGQSFKFNCSVNLMKRCLIRQKTPTISGFLGKICLMSHDSANIAFNA